MKTSSNEGSRNWLPPLFCWLYAAVLLWILGLLTLGQPSLSSYYRYPICVSNAILLPLAAGLIGLWVWRGAEEGRRYGLQLQRHGIADAVADAHGIQAGSKLAGIGGGDEK